MGLLSYLRGDRFLEDAYSTPASETRSLPRPENELPLLAAYTATNITPTSALAIADVWAAVRVLADAASSLPLHVYRKTEDGRQRVTSGKLADLLEQPAPGTSQADLVSSLMCHLAVYGAGYLARILDGWPPGVYRNRELAGLDLGPDALRGLRKRARNRRHGHQIRFERPFL